MANVVEILVTAKNATTEGFAAASAEGDSMGAKLSKVGAIGGVALAAIAVASVKMATDFQSSTQRLVTSAGETSSNLQLVRNGLLNMAGQVGVSAEALSKAMYYVESAGYHGAQGLVVLKAAAQGAKAEGADTTTVAQALTDVLVDYHDKASAAATVTSQMIAAVAHGKTNLQDFSSAFASIVPQASATGISFASVAAALSEMTNHGFTAQRASTDLAHALGNLLSPTKPMQKAFADFGVTTAGVASRLQGPNGLAAAMEYLSQAALKAGKEGTPAYTAALKSLMGSIPGLNSALATTGENFAGTVSAFKATSGATADAKGNVAGFAAIQKTFAQQLSQVTASAESLAIQFGQKLLPPLQAVMGWIANHQTAVKDLAIAFIGLVSAITLVSGAMKLISIFSNPWMALAVGLMIVAALIIKYHTQIWAFIQKIWHDVASYISGTWDSIYSTGSRIWNQIYSDTIGTVIRLFDGIKKTVMDGSKVWDAVYSDTIGAVVRLFDGIKSTITGAFDGWWKSHGAELEQVWKAVWTGISTVFKALWTVFYSLFKIQVALVTTLWKVTWDWIVTYFKFSWNIFYGLIKLWLGILYTLWKVSWDLVTAYFKLTWAGIVAVFKITLALIEGAAKIAWDAVAAYVKIVWAGIVLVLKTTWDVLVGLFDIFLDLVTGHWSKAWQDAQNLATQVWNNIQQYLGSVWNAIKGLASQVWNAISGTISGIWHTIQSTVSNVFNTMVSAGKNVVGGLLHGIESTMSGIGSWVKNTIVDPIINAVKSFFGIHSPSTVMAGLGGHLVGGLVKGVVESASGLSSLMHSVFGSMPETLLHLIEKGLIGVGGLPGKALSALQGLGSGALNILKGLGGDIGGLWDTLFGGGGSGGGGYSGPGGGSEAANAALARQLFPKWGSGGEWTAWNNVAMAESGWNQYAMNPGSGAYGIAQALPYTKYPKAGWPASAGGSSNPTAQITWMASYIAGRYGDPIGAWAHEMADHWYANGGGVSAGLAMVGERGRELVKLPGGAHVYSHGATERMVSGGGGGPVVVQLVVSSSGQAAFDEFMAGWMKKYVRVKGGGSVQAAFGKD